MISHGEELIVAALRRIATALESKPDTKKGPWGSLQCHRVGVTRVYDTFWRAECSDCNWLGEDEARMDGAMADGFEHMRETGVELA